MHDIDRTQKELEMESHELENEYEQEGEQEQGESFLGALFSEAEYEQEAEGEQEYEAEGGHEFEGEEEYEAEGGHEFEGGHELEAESPLSEAQEMELASELLEVSNEAELEYFLGGIGKLVSRGVNFMKSPRGRAITGILKPFAKKLLPIAGTVLGGAVGGPLGSTLGGRLGNMASGLFELELEGLSHEDREFEVARRVVRTSAAAVKHAAHTPRHVPPRTAARRAFTSAARVHAPGALRARPGGGRGRHLHHPHHRHQQQQRRHGSGHGGRSNGPGYVRRANGTTGASGGPSYGHRRGHGSGYEGYGYEGYGSGGSAGYGGRRAGRWIRRGRNIVLLGL